MSRLTTQELEALFVQHVGRFGGQLRFDAFNASSYYRFARAVEREAARRAQLDGALASAPAATEGGKVRRTFRTFSETGVIAAIVAIMFPGR